MAGQKQTQKDSSTGVSSATRTLPQATKRNTTSSNTPEQQQQQSSTTPKIQEIIDDEEELDETEQVIDKDEDDEDEDSDASDSSDISSIPDVEKWRLIKESGIMEQVKAKDDQSRSRRQRNGEEGDEDEGERDYIFEGIFFSIPTACLFIVMDIIVHRQYAETYSGPDVFRKIIKIFPAVLIMVYFSNKHKTSKLVQAAMFMVSTICGCYFLHTMYRAPALGIMLRAPGIITILVYCVVQLNLLPAVISLAFCGLYYQFGNVKYR